MGRITGDVFADALKYFWIRGSTHSDFGSKGSAVITALDQERKMQGVSYVCKREYDFYGNEYFTKDCPSTALKRMYA